MQFNRKTPSNIVERINKELVKVIKACKLCGSKGAVVKVRYGPGVVNYRFYCSGCKPSYALTHREAPTELLGVEPAKKNEVFKK